MRRELREPSLAKFIVAAMWQPELSLEVVRAEIEQGYGPVATASAVFDFDFTSYYQPEMGSGLKKCFFQIVGEYPRNTLPKLKLRAMELEEKYLKDGKRLLNLDPMLLSLENLVIATSKNFPHRIYLGKRIYGDLALVRKKGHYEPLPWTYADYIAYKSFFENLQF